jgi:hypothetical protein
MEADSGAGVGGVAMLATKASSKAATAATRMKGFMTTS